MTHDLFAGDLAKRIDHLPWDDITARLNQAGFATFPPLLTVKECQRVDQLFEQSALFRKQVDMAAYGYGKGVYQYFADPLPAGVLTLRRKFYEPLADVANTWMRQLGNAWVYPRAHEAYRLRCHRAGQCLPTPLLLRYVEGGFNCLHQDVYGELVFPFQVVILLHQQGADFGGGEFLLSEQRYRAQARGHVVPLQQGGGVIFPVHTRPVLGKRGWVKANVRHGVSTLHWGCRSTLGLIFHDAKS